MGFAEEIEMEMDVPSPKTIKKEKPKKVEEVEEIKEEGKEKKKLTVQDVLYNHENRLIEMEAKWFRLGGI